MSGRWTKTKYRRLEMVIIGEVSLTWPPGLAKQLRAPAVRLDILVEILFNRCVTLRRFLIGKSERASTYHIGMVV